MTTTRREISFFQFQINPKEADRETVILLSSFIHTFAASFFSSFHPFSFSSFVKCKGIQCSCSSGGGGGSTRCINIRRHVRSRKNIPSFTYTTGEGRHFSRLLLTQRNRKGEERTILILSLFFRPLERKGAPFFFLSSREKLSYLKCRGKRSESGRTMRSSGRSFSFFFGCIF